MKRGRWVGGVLVALTLFTLDREARAADCDPASGISTCFDANNLWPSAGPTRFAGIAAAAPARERALAFALLLSYLDRPVQLSAPSPDPEGREVAVVRDAVDLSMAWAYGLGRGVELDVASAIVLHQRGAGAEGVTSQSGPPLGSVAVRDPRLGVGYALPWPALDPHAALKARLELALPLGDERLYAGAGAFTLAPSVVTSFRHGALHGAGEVGARLRRSVPFATARVGSQLLTALGGGVDVLGEALSFELEAYLLPTLVSQPGRDNAASRVKDGLLVPSEWLASIRSVPTSDRGFSLALGGGTGLPLSSETRLTSAGESSESFAGVTTPRFRLFFAVRYEPTP